MHKANWEPPKILSVSGLPKALGHCYDGGSEMPGDETAGGGCFSGQETGTGTPGEGPHTCNTGGYAGGLVGCENGSSEVVN